MFKIGTIVKDRISGATAVVVATMTCDSKRELVAIDQIVGKPDNWSLIMPVWIDADRLMLETKKG